MDIKQRILVAGDVKGNFNKLFTRVETINKKSGPFELLLCIGNFFGDNNDELIAYKNGFKNVPVPTYILGPNNSKTNSYYENLNDGEICSNLTYLGKRGLYTVSSGVKIAYLSGLQETETDKNEWNFTKEDIIAVRNSCIVNKSTMGDYRGVDILITSQWPKGIYEKEGNNTSQMIAWLAYEIKPRYHFCGLNEIFYERLPYRNCIGNTTQMELATRFIALSNVGNTDKSKNIYALCLTPVDKMRVIELIQKTTNETPCPYNEIDFKMESSVPVKDGSTQFFYDMKNYDADDGYGKKRGKSGKEFDRKRQRPNYDQEKCWFCLSSENVEKHLVISIGENFYLALAKGPLNDLHILILSVTHIQSSALLSDDDWAELKKFKNALKSYFTSKNMVASFFERNYKCAHLQINVIGVDANKEWQIKHAFEDKAGEYDLPFENVPELTEPTLLPSHGPFFIAELPDNTALLTRQMKLFPLHFGREVFCSENLLNCDEKSDWRQCLLSKDDEIKLVKSFRDDFKKFDFTL